MFHRQQQCQHDLWSNLQNGQLQVELNGTQLAVDGEYIADDDDYYAMTCCAEFTFDVHYDTHTSHCRQKKISWEMSPHSIPFHSYRNDCYHHNIYDLWIFMDIQFKNEKKLFWTCWARKEREEVDEITSCDGHRRCYIQTIFAYSYRDKLLFDKIKSFTPRSLFVHFLYNEIMI